MKAERKNIYQEMRYGKKALTIVGFVVMILSLIAFAGGVLLVVFGSMNDGGAWEIIWRVVLGAILIIFGAIFFGVGFTMLAVTRSMVDVEEGNVSDMGNRAKGTVNITKCPKCGTKLDENAKFCKKCGANLEGKVCPNCGQVAPLDADFCENCGKELK